ncbi:serine transporter [Providencia stuartii]|nr:serine transporter [Providencia stuartii]
MTAGVLFGRDLMLRLTSVMVYPLVFHFVSFVHLLYPRWNTSMLEVSPDWAAMPVVIWMADPAYRVLIQP